MKVVLIGKDQVVDLGTSRLPTTRFAIATYALCTCHTFGEASQDSPDHHHPPPNFVATILPNPIRNGITIAVEESHNTAKPLVYAHVTFEHISARLTAAYTEAYI